MHRREFIVRGAAAGAGAIALSRCGGSSPGTPTSAAAAAVPGSSLNAIPGHMDTRFTRLVGCKLPIQNAGMGGVGSAELAVAVARAGGLGMVPSNIEAPQGEGVVGVNFLVPDGYDLDAIAAAAKTARVVEFFYAGPEREPVTAAHDAGALVSWQVGSRDEARAAVDAGCDLIVAQGIEAGGHVRGKERLDVLLPQVRKVVGETPVVAAGGIATAERVAALMQAGADAVRVGTRFVVAPECDAHPGYVKALLAARGAQDTALTEQFNEGWPNAPHRVLASALRAAKKKGWHRVTPPSSRVAGPVDFMALYAGEGVGDVRRVEPAADIVKDLMRLLA